MLQFGLKIIVKKAEVMSQDTQSRETLTIKFGEDMLKQIARQRHPLLAVGKQAGGGYHSSRRDATISILNKYRCSKAGIIHVGKKSARLKWDWAGHVCRMHPDTWAILATKWIPQDGRRRRGRPRRRWRDDIDAFLQNWQSEAQDRDEWRNRGEAFAQQWDTIQAT
ncbi:hypothetical protein NE865_05735 [Phthorimaea operculella]|nr:hypothetical protein NE865_05735 [Phthorimaea operculella]